jgi:hypothetical protein
MIPSTVDGLTPGEWADWAIAAGTFLAFGATSLAIWRSHRLRQVEHGDAMYDEALKVISSVGQGSDGVRELDATGSYSTRLIPKVQVTICNGSRREISNVKVIVTTRAGQNVGSDTLGFLQSGRDQTFQYDPIDGVWERVGASPVIHGFATLSFEDIDGTLWTSMPNGRLFRTPLLPRWRRRKGQRHRPGPMLP